MLMYMIPYQAIVNNRHMTMSFYLFSYDLFLDFAHQTIFDCRNLSKVSKSMAINIFFWFDNVGYVLST